MGYFQRDQRQNYGPIASSAPSAQGELSRQSSGDPHWPSPDFGPQTPSPTKGALSKEFGLAANPRHHALTTGSTFITMTGVSCIGALDWVVNINMPIPTNDMKLAKAVTSKVRQLEGMFP